MAKNTIQTDMLADESKILNLPANTQSELDAKMNKSVYDPSAIEADVYARANHTGTQAETTISFTDITTGNTSTTKHGFAPKLSGNPNQYLDGNGNFSLPGDFVNDYTTFAFTNETTVVINHGFSAFPIVQVLGTSNEQIIPQSIIHNNTNTTTVTFVQSTSGNVVLSVGSPQASNLTTVTGNYTATGADNILKVITIGAVITLPTALGIEGSEYKIDNDTIGDIFIDTTGAETIQGEEIQTIPSQSSITVYSDGTNWRIN